jgi:hypothetical protein
MSLSAQTYAVIQFGPEAKAAIEKGTFLGSPNRVYAGPGLGSNAFLNGQIYSRAFESEKLEELTLLECIDAYSTTFQSTGGNVFLVVDQGVMNITDAYGIFPVISPHGECSAETVRNGYTSNSKKRSLAGVLLRTVTDTYQDCKPIPRSGRPFWASR